MSSVRVESGTELLDAIFAAGITFITGVPDSEFTDLISVLERAELDQRYVRATREDNALALAVGAFLAGEQPLVFMESSGIGNSIDALTSLAMAFGVPVVLFIAWAGYEGRDVPHHNSIGKPLRPLLEALRVPTFEVDLGMPPERIGAAVRAAVDAANDARCPTAVLGIPEKLKRERP
jgi:phosphonopyruvate decarboxylase